MGKKGVALSEETKEKLRCANLGKKYSKEINLKKGRKGKKVSEETKRKISLSKKGKPVSQEVIERLRKSNLGRKRSEESKRKQSKTLRKRFSEGKIVPTWLGKKHSEDYKQKMSVAINQPEIKEKIKVSAKKRWTDPNSIYNSSEYRKKLSESRTAWKNVNFGKHLSEETRKKLSNSHLGKSWGKHTEESKRRISQKNKGRIVSETTAKKISLNRKGKTYEQIMGEERAKKVRLNKSLKMLGNNNPYKIKYEGKTYEEIHGNETAKKLKELRAKAWLGEKNINWVGGDYPHYYGENWRSQKKLVLKRAMDICEKCEKPSPKTLHIHHKKPFRTFIIEYIINNEIKNEKLSDVIKIVSINANNLNNLIGLCSSCHKIDEAKARKEYYSYKHIETLKMFKGRNITLKIRKNSAN